MINEIRKLIDRRLAGLRLAYRGVITLVNAAGAVQLVQGEGLSGENGQDDELFQHYGYTSNPPPGTMKIVLPIGGKTSHSIIIATEHGDYRLQGLKSGEVAIYTDEGDRIVLKRGRLIEVTTETLRINTLVMEVNADTKIDFNTPMVTCSQQATVQQRINGNGGMAINNTNGSGATATITGNISQTAGGITTDHDVVAQGISLHGHSHGDPQGGTVGTPI